jgi:hypothetical protein
MDYAEAYRVVTFEDGKPKTEGEVTSSSVTEKA